MFVLFCLCFFKVI